MNWEEKLVSLYPLRRTENECLFKVNSKITTNRKEMGDLTPFCLSTQRKAQIRAVGRNIIWRADQQGLLSALLLKGTCPAVLSEFPIMLAKQFLG